MQEAKEITIQDVINKRKEHTRKIDKEYLAKTQEMRYNKDEVQCDRVPSGLCG